MRPLVNLRHNWVEEFVLYIILCMTPSPSCRFANINFKSMQIVTRVFTCDYIMTYSHRWSVQLDFENDDIVAVVLSCRTFISGQIELKHNFMQLSMPYLLTFTDTKKLFQSWDIQYKPKKLPELLSLFKWKKLQCCRAILTHPESWCKWGMPGQNAFDKRTRLTCSHF